MGFTKSSIQVELIWATTPSFIRCNSQALTSLSTQATAFGPMVMGLGKSPAFIFKYMVGFDMHTLAAVS